MKIFQKMWFLFSLKITLNPNSGHFLTIFSRIIPLFSQKCSSSELVWNVVLEFSRKVGTWSTFLDLKSPLELKKKYNPETFMVLDWIGYKMSAELACTYAALILNDDDVEITGDKITAILKVTLIAWVMNVSLLSKFDALNDYHNLGS